MRLSDYRFELRALVLALVLGPLAVLLASELLLVRFRAATSLPLHGDVQLYRRAEEVLRSTDWFRRFSQGKATTEAHIEIDNQLRRGASKPLAIEHSFRLSRSDLRELPDIVAKEVVPQIQITRGILSELTVYATGREPELAAQIAVVGMQFARDTLLRISLMDSLRAWNVNAASELASVRSSMISFRSSVESLSRRIREMEHIRDKYREVTVPSVSEAAVQIQVTGARFLSPLQQIVGLESERVDKAEELKLAEASAERLETIARIGATIDRLFATEPSAGAALERMLTELSRERARLGASEPPLPVAMALAEIEQALIGLRARFLNTAPLPSEPAVRREGPGRGLPAVAGLLAGLALWLGLLRLRWRWPDWRPKPANAPSM